VGESLVRDEVSNVAGESVGSTHQMQRAQETTHSRTHSSLRTSPLGTGALRAPMRLCASVPLGAHAL